MDRSPPPLPSKKKKGKGCLTFFFVTLVGFGALLLVGVIANRETQKEWYTDREKLLLKIETAINEGNAEEALKLAKPYSAVEDPALRDLSERAITLKAAQRAESERKEWNTNRESLLLKIEAAINEGNPDEALQIARPYRAIEDQTLKDLVEKAMVAQAGQQAENDKIAAKKRKPSIEPYPYESWERSDVSYGKTSRMVERLYLKTDEIPSKDRMQETAKRVWENGNKHWSEFTVFMTFGQMKNSDYGAYGIAEFRPSGLKEFRVDETSLEILRVKLQGVLENKRNDAGGSIEKTPSEQLTERLNLALGTKEGNLTKGAKWQNLREVQVIGNGKVNIRFYADSRVKLTAFNSLAALIPLLFEDKETKYLSIKILASYPGENEKMEELPWISLILDRTKSEKADWKKLKDSGKVETFLRRNGEVTFRHGDDS